MVPGKWYNIEQVCMKLFDRTMHPIAFDYEKAFENEYFFKEEELSKTRELFKDSKKKRFTTLGTDARNISDLITKKRYKNEVRKKRPNSVKFIIGEI